VLALARPTILTFAACAAIFAEPFNAKVVSKNIFNLTYANGYKYGSNTFSADWLVSDDKDPASAGSSSGAQEVYVLYRHTLDLEKTTGKSFKFGPVRGVGVTAAETNIDLRLMYDLSSAVGAGANTFKVGLGYQYWKNKFGNDSANINGALAKTPMIRAEYHF
jgi:hypothetical protein